MASLLSNTTIQDDDDSYEDDDFEEYDTKDRGAAPTLNKTSATASTADENAAKADLSKANDKKKIHLLEQKIKGLECAEIEMMII
mmetsp:Transcript_3348/g.5364  ORF Transcript_3348/g.5364 Transcript_3348/m.5364 type:complete len:85 (-) Transcript_3348:4-258(-)